MNLMQQDFFRNVMAAALIDVTHAGQRFTSG